MQALRMANHLDRGRFRISIAVMRRGGAYESTLRSDIPVHCVGGGVFQTGRGLRKLLRMVRPNVVCSFLDVPNLLALLAARSIRDRPRVVTCVQAPPTIVHRGARMSGRSFVLRGIKVLYPYSDRVIAISRGVGRDLINIVPEVRDRIEIVYNAGLDGLVDAGAREELGPHEGRPSAPLIVACGRLTEQKGFLGLLDAFVLVRRTVPAHLWIIGEGEQRALLHDKIRRLGLGDCIRLLGFQPNPYKFMAVADVFVLSSVFEGFGNVVVEAMACGAAVVATDCDHGPREIIRDGENGLLVRPGDVGALARAIVRILQDPALRAGVVAKGRERAQDFSAPVIAREYERVFEALLRQRGSRFGSEIFA